MNARVRQYQQALVGMGDTRPFYFWTSPNVPRNEWRNPHPPNAYPGMPSLLPGGNVSQVVPWWTSTHYPF